jgi:hypothetical protein
MPETTKEADPTNGGELDGAIVIENEAEDQNSSEMWAAEGREEIVRPKR